MDLKFVRKNSTVNESDELDSFLRGSQASFKEADTSILSQESSLKDRSTLAILRMANKNTVQEEIEYRNSLHLKYTENEKLISRQVMRSSTSFDEKLLFD